jgi:hypothetical protein
MTDGRDRSIYTLRLTSIEYQALKEALKDICDYVDSEMFSSPKGLSAFNRIVKKMDEF